MTMEMVTLIVLVMVMMMMRTIEGKARTLTPNNYITLEVDCLQDRIKIVTRTLDPFTGVVYARSGPWDRDGRSWGSAKNCKARGVGRHQVSLQVGAGQCGWREVEQPTGDMAVQLDLYVQYDAHVQQVIDERMVVQCDMAREEGRVEIPHLGGVNRMGVAAGERDEIHQQNVIVKAAFVSDPTNGQVVSNLVQNKRKVTVESPQWKVVGQKKMEDSKNNNKVGGAREKKVEEVHGWLDLVAGAEPFGAPLGRILQVGEQLNLVARVRQPPGRDTRVGGCQAQAGRGGDRHQLTDWRGCSLDTNLMPDLTTSYNSVNKVKVFHTTFAAFKLPEDEELIVSCEVLVCENNCPVVRCEEEDSSGRGEQIEQQEVGVVLETSALVASPPEAEIDEEEEMVEDEELVGDLDAGEINSYMEEEIIQSSSQLCLSPSRIILAFGVLLMVLVLALLFSCVLWMKARGQVRPRPPGHPRHRHRGPYVLPPRNSPYVRVIQ